MKWSISYSKRFRPTLLSRWVHRSIHGKRTTSGRSFAAEAGKVVVEFFPPVPVVVGKGYPLITADLDGESFSFASLDEVSFLIEHLNDEGVDEFPWFKELPAAPFTKAKRAKCIAALRELHEEVIATGEIT